MQPPLALVVARLVPLTSCPPPWCTSPGARRSCASGGATRTQLAAAATVAVVQPPLARVLD